MKISTLYIQLLFVLSTLLYCNALPYFDQEKKDDERDLQNYRNCRNIDRDIGYGGRKTLDVYYDKNTTNNLKPVYIFLYGGAWVSGSKVKFTKFGSLLERNGYVAVIPDYILFPKGGFEDMVDDVYKTFRWTFDHIRKYGGDPNRVSVAGYSAGSHLATLTLVKTLFGIQNKNDYLRPLPNFEKMVLLSGPYDFNDYSSLSKLIKGSSVSLFDGLAKLLFKTKNVSPTEILKDFPSNFSRSLGANKFVFFYALNDREIKESSAKNLMSEMKRVCPTVNIQYVTEPGLEHTTLTRGVRAGDKRFEDIFMRLVRM